MANDLWETARSEACRAAAMAWQAIEGLYRSGNEIEQTDEGPSTSADHLADSVILDHLRALFPTDEFGYLTEESEDDRERLARRRVWIIDPIDGTVDFIKKTGNFTVHVAMVEELEPDVWRPVAAAVYRPLAQEAAEESSPWGLMYSAVRGRGSHSIRYENHAAAGQPEPVRVSGRATIPQLRAVMSSTHRDGRLDSLIEAFGFAHVRSVGSMGVKMNLVSSGEFDCYINPVRGRVREWDSCAPELILTEAGGRVTGCEGTHRSYNRESVYLENGLVASNGQCHDALIERLAEIEASLDQV